MELTSSAFDDGGTIPDKHTCDGENVNPALRISDVSEEAQSLVLIMDDPDIPDFAAKKAGKPVWDHWIVFNIAPDVRDIPEGKEPNGMYGKGSAGNTAYYGPCPPDGEHRYFFKLYALDTELDLEEGCTKESVEEAMNGHIIAQTELMGRYCRPENR